MRSYLLEETNWKEVKGHRPEVVILPWGATEAHNYHLPYGTDNYIATKLAAECARIAGEKGAKVKVLPTLPFGVNTGQPDILLDMNLNPGTQFLILKDLLTVFAVMPSAMNAPAVTPMAVFCEPIEFNLRAP